ncbi:hypothetical protein B7494_g5156 [Chlorociboria aeruginascens]|nr:hypothetical protein B7494_g5156 [Chlorociboria aeruginascens]
MDSLVLEDSPLAVYLEGQGGEGTHDEEIESSSSSPSFAPRGKPTVQLKSRNKVLPPRLAISQNNAIAAIRSTCSKAVNSRLGRADNARFLEQFRYIIVASQLLSVHSYNGQTNYGLSRDPPSPKIPAQGSSSLAGAAITAFLAFGLVWLIHWTRGSKNFAVGKGRLSILVALVALLAILSYCYVRRQWHHYLRLQTLATTTSFVEKALDFDAAISGALTLVQEVELVSRGYRLSTPLPPISRLDDRSQTRRCARLRKTIRLCLADLISRYNQACTALQPFAVQMDLEKYYDIYDINEMDSSEAMSGYSENEFEDPGSLRVLKILVARFHTIRRIFLCCLLALDAHDRKPDFNRWSTTLDEIEALGAVTSDANERLRRVLGEEETFPVPATPKIPLTPSRERWRAQLRKLNSLSSGIRSLQAKLHVLRDESDKNLNNADDVTELGTNLMVQYESIGIDLKALMQEWEDGKAALASNIDRNERRISSLSGILSPTTSLGGITAVEEGSASDALNILNGETRSPSSLDFSSSDAEEVFEAVALPRQRNALTREERIVKMKEDRAKRDSMRDKAEANTHMLRELESVINLRPRGRTTPAGRITSI